MALDMFAVLFGGVTAMLPVFAAEILHVGPSGLGWLRSAPAIGAILMGTVLVRRPIRGRAGHLLAISVIGFGFCILGFGLSTDYRYSMLLLMGAGAFDSISMVIRGAIVQLSSPESMRGRIAAINSVFIGVSNEVGEFESGTAAKLLGIVPSVVFGGVMTFVVVGLMFWKVPELRTLDLSEIEKNKSGG
jgi:MFS family permease